jgi:hypothetical protein
MGIRFQCPDCFESLNVKDQLAGRRGKCPHCGASLRIPGSASGEAAVDESPVAAAVSAPPPPRVPPAPPLPPAGLQSVLAAGSTAAPPLGEAAGGLSAVQLRRARELQKRRQRQLFLSVALLLMALGLLSALVWVLARSTA